MASGDLGLPSCCNHVTNQYHKYDHLLYNLLRPGRYGKLLIATTASVNTPAPLTAQPPVAMLTFVSWHLQGCLPGVDPGYQGPQRPNEQWRRNPHESQFLPSGYHMPSAAGMLV